MIETSFEYPKDIGVLNYDYVEMTIVAKMIVY